MSKLYFEDRSKPSKNTYHYVLQTIMSFRDLVGNEVTNEFAHTEIEDFNIEDDFLDDAIERIDDRLESGNLAGYDVRLIHATRAFLVFLCELPEEWRVL